MSCETVRVLVIEDNEDDVALVRELLGESRERCFVVEHAPDCQAGIAALGAGRFDAVLLDLSLPDCAGLDTCLRIVREAPSVPVVVLTGREDQELGLTAVQRGAQDYVMKRELCGPLLSRAIRYAIERKWQEVEKQRIEERLGQAQKRENLARLAGAIANHLRNRVTTILGHLQLAKADLPPDSKVCEHLAEASVAAEGVADVCRQMIGIAGEGSSSHRPVRLSRLIEQSADLLRCTAPPNVGITFDLAGNLPWIEGDELQLRQILFNLVSNASEAMQQTGGTILIRTSMARASNRHVVLEVSDTGPGIDPTAGRRIFNPFFSTKSPGCGLGLAAVEGIARRHHAAVHVSSREGRGSVVAMSFPVLSELTAGVAEPASPPRDEPAGGDVILLVEADERLRTTTGQLLAQAGFQVLPVATSRQAWAALEERPTEIATALVDPAGTGASAEELIQGIRRFLGQRSIVWSGSAGRPGTSASCLGPSIHLPKPFGPQALFRAIAEAVGKPLREAVGQRLETASGARA